MTAQTWTAPEVERVRPPNVAAERVALEAWLDYHRATLLMKWRAERRAAQAPAAPAVHAVAARSGPSPDRSGACPGSVAVSLAGADRPYYATTTRTPTSTMSDADGRARLPPSPRRWSWSERVRQGARRHLRAGGPLDVRWTYLHMIEEYARHNGHADLLRERIDGAPASSSRPRTPSPSRRPDESPWPHRDFTIPGPSTEPTMRHLQRVVDRVGIIQVDSVNVLVRSHYLPAYSRLGPYDVGLLERARDRAPRRLVEYWAHEASLVPPSTIPLLRWRMDRWREEAWGGMQRVQRDHAERRRARCWPRSAPTAR